MDINTYSQLAFRTARRDKDMIENAVLGIGGESGEILDLIKKVRHHDKPLDDQKLKEEIGDLVWYINELILVQGYTWAEILEMNIKKLEARYPDLRFDVDRANNRDVEAEAKAMQQ